MRKLFISLLCLMITSLALAALSDPTKPATHFQGTTNDFGLTLTYLQVGAKTKRVVINGQLLSIGDSIVGMKIINIKPSGVILQGKKETITLPLIADTIKKVVTRKTR